MWMSDEKLLKGGSNQFNRRHVGFLSDRMLPFCVTEHGSLYESHTRLT
jgi:hypothetical protein